MRKLRLLIIAICTLTGCQSASGPISPAPANPLPATPPDSVSAAPPATLLRAAPHRPRRPVVRYRITLVSSKPQNLLRINNHGLTLFSDRIIDGKRRISLKWPNGSNYSDLKAENINTADVVVGHITEQNTGAITTTLTDTLCWRNGEVEWPSSGLEDSCAALYINTHGDLAGQHWEEPWPPGASEDELSNPHNYAKPDEHRAFASIGHKFIDLGRGQVNGLNDKGQVVVSHPQALVSKEAENDPILDSYIWDKGKKTPLVLPHGCSAPSFVAINNSTQIVGTLRLPPNKHSTSGSDHAVLWQKGVFTDLGTLGGPTSYASAINNRGQVVGVADIAQKTADHRALFHAFLWQKGRIYDLNTLIPRKSGWVLREAASINDKGQIVGNGSKGVFLLTPISNRPLK